MIKPYNTQNKITKENSMFNFLPINYNEHTKLEHLIHIYETTIILQTEIPKNIIENKLRFHNYKVK